MLIDANFAIAKSDSSYKITSLAHSVHKPMCKWSNSQQEDRKDKNKSAFSAFHTESHTAVLILNNDLYFYLKTDVFYFVKPNLVLKIVYSITFVSRFIGGESGIRTLGRNKPTTVFETAPFNRSGNSPRKLIHLKYLLSVCEVISYLQKFLKISLFYEHHFLIYKLHNVLASEDVLIL